MSDQEPEGPSSFRRAATALTLGVFGGVVTAAIANEVYNNKSLNFVSGISATAWLINSYMSLDLK
ncbi:MAG: hypothetical protein PHE27_06655 [Alphaproteobacteria bacterium]|nr:hypothetical protein [Alphaproteobacteria bacterium]